MEYTSVFTRINLDPSIPWWQKFKFKRQIKSALKLTHPKSKVYEIGGVWGHSIQWTGKGTDRVHGWRMDIPNEGDYLLGRVMTPQGEKTGVLVFTRIERQYDPPDMFFAKVVQVGYKE